MKKQPTWILVADRGRARVFEAGEDDRLNEVACFVDPDARAGESGLTTDRPPTVNESMGFARHSIEPHTPLRDKISARFARLLCDALEAGRALGEAAVMQGMEEQGAHEERAEHHDFRGQEQPHAGLDRVELLLGRVEVVGDVMFGKTGACGGH